MKKIILYLVSSKQINKLKEVQTPTLSEPVGVSALSQPVGPSVTTQPGNCTYQNTSTPVH